MILLTVEEVILLHDKLIEQTGGEPGLRDLNLLASAVFSASAGFGEEEAYPDIEEKAARLAFALTKNHPFIDGNKRIGVSAMLVTLRLNGVQLQYSQQELVELGIGLAKGSLDYKAVLAWVNSHRIQIKDGQ